MSNEQELWQQIKDKPYCDPNRRMDFVLLFDVKDGNPNGDPDAGNLPRMDPTTRHGITTDVSTKRKIRDYFVEVLGRSIFIQSESSLNALYFRTARDVPEAKEVLAQLKPDENSEYKELMEQDDNEVEGWLAQLDAEYLEFDPDERSLSYLGELTFKKVKKTTKVNQIKEALIGGAEVEDQLAVKLQKLASFLADAIPAAGKREKPVRDAIKAKMCAKYDDIRLFGAVLTAGTNAGQIRGPMQFKFARSVEPILQQDAAITRCAITKESDRTRKDTEFGRKAWLSYAAYRQHGYFNAPLAEQTGITCDDLARFWEAIACMFPHAQSASKGEMATQDLVVFVHPNTRGNAPAHRLLDRVKYHDNGRPRLGFGENGGDEIDSLIAERNIEVYRPLQDMWGDL